jgi:uncharacterized protein (TIGR04255 family)
MEGHPPLLRRAPLQIVAVELRFPEAVLVPEDLKQIRRGLADAYPASGTEHGIGIEFSLEGAGAVRQQQTTQRQVYRTADGSHQIGLTSSALVLEARGATYEGFEHFLERWLTAVDVVEPVVEIGRQLRVGLRYINQFQLEDASPGLAAMDDRINPALLSPRGADGFEYDVSVSFHELRLQSKQGKATLRHGLQPIGDGVPQPGIYLLDIDYYDDEIASFERDRHLEQMKLFNWRIWQLFRWSVTDAEYERMQPEERE